MSRWSHDDRSSETARRRHHDDGENGDEAGQPRAQFGEIGLEIDRADRFAVEHDLAEERQLLGAEHRLVGLNGRRCKWPVTSLRV